MSEEKITIVKGEVGLELPHEAGNWVLKKDLGYSPVEMLVSATAACGGYVYQTILTNSRIDHTFHRVEVNYTRDATRQAKPLASVTIHYYVTVAEAKRERALRASKLIHGNCPVIQSLGADVNVEDVVHFVAE